MNRRINKYVQVAKVVWTDALTFRFRAFVWTLIDVTWLFVMPLLWIAARGEASAYTKDEIITYYFFGGAIGILTTAYVHYDLRQDILSGLFTNTLMKPLRQWWYRLAEHAAYKLFRIFLFVPFLIIFWFLFRPQIDAPIDFGMVYFIAALILAFVIEFLACYCIGLSGLFLQDGEPMNNVYNIIFAFLSGEAAPLALMPYYLQTVALHSPFYFMLGFPIEVAMGRTSIPLAEGIAWQCVWVVVLILLAAFIWRRGIAQYQAHGR